MTIKLGVGFLGHIFELFPFNYSSYKYKNNMINKINNYKIIIEKYHFYTLYFTNVNYYTHFKYRFLFSNITVT